MRIFATKGIAGTTVAETSTNTVQDIDTGVSGISFKNSDSELISGILITCGGNDLRYSFTATPVESGLGHVLVKDRDGVYIEGAANIRAFKFISAIADAHATLAITPFYGDK